MSLSHLLRTAPAPLTAIGLLGGFALIATGILPLAIGGAVFIGLGLLVPYLRLPTDRGGRTQDVDDAADVGSMRALHRERSDAAQGQASMPETWPWEHGSATEFAGEEVTYYPAKIQFAHETIDAFVRAGRLQRERPDHPDRPLKGRVLRLPNPVLQGLIEGQSVQEIAAVMQTSEEEVNRLIWEEVSRLHADAEGIERAEPVPRPPEQ